MIEKVAAIKLGDYIGKDLAPSAWLPIEQERVNQFADATSDHQFIHIDPAAAAKTPFGGTIAHGFLTLSLLSPLCAQFMVPLEGMVMAINYGFDRIRFVTPVKTGSRIRARSKLVEVSLRQGRVVTKGRVTVEIEGEDKPALIADWLGMSVMES